MRVLITLTLIAAVSSAASADHCSTYSTTAPELTIHAPGGVGYYFDFDCGNTPECWPFGVWLYEESNGIAGLQRDDEQRDDTCHGLIDGDLIIF